jgi:hypothetical protein
MSTFEKPEGAIGNWRIPTVEEASLFVLNTALSTGNESKFYFCLDGDVLKWIRAINLHSTPETQLGTNYNSSVNLRAVINITY